MGVTALRPPSPPTYSLRRTRITHATNVTPAEEELALVANLHAAPCAGVFAVAGAGTQAIAWLLSVAGASRTVLELGVPYSAPALAELVGYDPDQAVSRQTALDMARAAYRRALRLRDADTPVAGVACTATIATDRPKRGEHRCHVACWTGSSSAVFSLQFVKGLRDRAGEDAVASRLTLQAFAEAAGVRSDLPLGLNDRERVEVERASYSDAVKALTAGHVDHALVSSGSAEADVPVRGAVLPGSFNPLHQGHRNLADVASRILGTPSTFELSITNVDKPPLAEREIRRRLAQFDDTESVAVTRAHVFYRKADLFPGCVFVIGWDTATRLVDPRYYDGSDAHLVSALEHIRAQGCRFLVAGREHDGAFRTLDDVSVPRGFGDLFDAIPESAFRQDVSSTELRGTLEARR